MHSVSRDVRSRQIIGTDNGYCARASGAPSKSTLCHTAILPFSRDADHVQRSFLLQKVDEKLSRSGRAALVVVGGVGNDPDVGSFAQRVS
jgi:hypothetical protein